MASTGIWAGGKWIKRVRLSSRQRKREIDLTECDGNVSGSSSSSASSRATAERSRRCGRGCRGLGGRGGQQGGRGLVGECGCGVECPIDRGVHGEHGGRGVHEDGGGWRGGCGVIVALAVAPLAGQDIAVAVDLSGTPEIIVVIDLGLDRENVLTISFHPPRRGERSCRIRSLYRRRGSDTSPWPKEK